MSENVESCPYYVDDPVLNQGVKFIPVKRAAAFFGGQSSDYDYYLTRHEAEAKVKELNAWHNFEGQS